MCFKVPLEKEQNKIRDSVQIAVHSLQNLKFFLCMFQKVCCELLYYHDINVENNNVARIRKIIKTTSLLLQHQYEDDPEVQCPIFLF